MSTSLAHPCWACKPHRQAREFFEDYPDWTITRRAGAMEERVKREPGLEGWYGITYWPDSKSHEMWIFLCQSCVYEFHAKKQFQQIAKMTL